MTDSLKPNIFAEGDSLFKFREVLGPQELPWTKELIRDFGWNTTCFQIANIGMSRCFCFYNNDPKPVAVIGFVLRNGVCVVAGAPVCPIEIIQEVISAWESFTKKRNQTVCYFGAEDRVRSALATHEGYSEVILGAQPAWHPSNWFSILHKNASFRAQLNRAKNKGVAIEEWAPVKAQNNPDLARVLHEWLTTKGLPPMHFLVEPETLGDLEYRRIFVALVKNIPVGFLVLSPIPSRNGYLTEQFIRGAQAPNGTVELAIDCGVQAIAASGSEYVTMGIVPLSIRASPQTQNNPRWLIPLMAWIRAHGRRFYNFDGLDSFKSKFLPEIWEPIFVITNERKFSKKSLYAIAGAFSDGPVPIVLIRAFFKAGVQELKWLSKRLAKRS